MDLATLLPLLVAAACAWLLWQPFRPLLRARRLRGQRVSIAGAQSPPGQPQLYYFWSPHCAKCRGMNRLVERLQERHPELRKVNILQDDQLIRSLRLAATPSLVLVRDGRVQKVLLGAQSEARILELLKRDE